MVSDLTPSPCHMRGHGRGFKIEGPISRLKPCAGCGVIEARLSSASPSGLAGFPLYIGLRQPKIMQSALVELA